MSPALWSYTDPIALQYHHRQLQFEDRVGLPDEAPKGMDRLAEALQASATFKTTEETSYMGRPSMVLRQGHSEAWMVVEIDDISLLSPHRCLDVSEHIATSRHPSEQAPGRRATRAPMSRIPSEVSLYRPWSRCTRTDNL